MSPTTRPSSRWETTAATSTARADWLVDAFKDGAPTTDSSIDATWRQMRQHHLQRGRGLEAGHRDFLGEKVLNRTNALVTQPVRGVLDILAGQFGISWVDIGKMVGVSVPALRKWRRDENGASGENHRRLAQLAAFCEVLNEAGVESPAQWLNVPFGADFTARPKDIYSETPVGALIDFAVSGGDFKTLLKAVDPDWRSRWARRYETIIADDGQPALASRRLGQSVEGDS